MNRQEAFDKVVRGIYAQGGPSVNEAGKCVYNSPTGKHCAAALLMDHPEKAVEGSALNLNKHCFIEEMDWLFIRALQVCHDAAAAESNFFRHWVYSMKKLAERYGLSTQILKELANAPSQ